MNPEDFQGFFTGLGEWMAVSIPVPLSLIVVLIFLVWRFTRS